MKYIDLTGRLGGPNSDPSRYAGQGQRESPKTASTKKKELLHLCELIL